jgi:predicted RNase H-like HicB family nuclease
MEVILMKYVYPAVFTPSEGGYDVYMPDLFGCRTCGDSIAEAIEMAEDALATWLWVSEDHNDIIPEPSDFVEVEHPKFVTLIKADTEVFRRTMDSKSVKKTLTIPAWLNYRAEEAHINFSGVLQEALKERLHLL